ncbi:MAG: hypothetical protein AB7E31_14655 [Desulfitobacterium sp.]
MIKEALQYLMGFRDVEIIDHDGIKYSNQQLVKFPEIKPNKIIETRSLASIVDLVKSELEHRRIDGLKIFVQVKTPTEVIVLTSLGDNLDRMSLYSAIADIPNLSLNNFIDLEKMNIHLKSCFLPTDDREKVIQILGNVTEEAVKRSTDDGFSQTVVAKVGIAQKGNVAVPSIVVLKPFRTFLEVDQPESEFLLRMRTGSEVALFEADGGAWKMKARKNVKWDLEYHLGEEIKAGRVVILE